tara:strand:+ start:3105 stop:4223 length:1119 start_codon:yes stop_codon:yes gene_type:complete
MSTSDKTATFKPVLLSAGGTGGHVMPAAALAIELKKRGVDVQWVTDPRGLKFKPHFKGIKVHTLQSGTLGAGVIGKIKGAAKLLFGLLQAQKLIRQMDPAIVVGFGGYPAFPALYAAQRAKIPTLLHEQNAIIGKANDMLAPKANLIASSVPELQGIDKETRAKTLYIGNPVRAEIAALKSESYPALDEKGSLNILVMGGSLGATIFSEVLPQALSKLPKDQKKRLNITQQCREEVFEVTQEAYEAAGISVNLVPFVEDVAGELAKAHLFIGRSGASTVAEVTAAGRPSIFVPYPHHKDQQQKRNADVIADAGGAWMMTQDGFTPEAVLARIETLLQNPESLLKAAQNAKNCGMPEAAQNLADALMGIISKK